MTGLPWFSMVQMATQISPADSQPCRIVVFIHFQHTLLPYLARKEPLPELDEAIINDGGLNVALPMLCSPHISE